MTPLSLWSWIVRRLLVAVPVILGVTSFAFVLIHLSPGDPIYLLAGDGGSPTYYAEMRAKYGLDRTLPEQFVRYVTAAMTGDLGYSFMFQAPVLQVIWQHAPASLLLGGAALAIAAVFGFLAGILAALHPSRGADRLVRITASIAYAAPVFWTGQILMMLFAVKLGLLPVGGMTSARGTASALGDAMWHLLLPAVTLALPSMAVVARVSRASVLETAREPFLIAAVARGLSRSRVIARHLIPPALIPVVALVGQHATHIVAGAALTESLFGWPGVGYLVLHASLHRDYPLVIALFIVISSSVVVFNALTDVVIACIDPRIRIT